MNIDINSDMGEGFGPYVIADDAALMAHVTSANVACGYHAGDPLIMDRTIRLARDHGVDLGAHVSFPDRMGFGRRKIDMPMAEIEAHVLYQLGALEGLARRAGHRITHMNPHGALGNLASSDPATAEAVASATMAFDPSLAFLVLPGSALERAVKDRGGRVVRLFLADRGYLSNGQLAPRGQPGAVIHDVGAVIARVLRVLRDARIETLDGPDIAMPVQSVLIHSDTAGALTLAQQLKAALIAEGISPTPISRHI
ncbi:3-beta hydroxysteroid dehydrogenase/isomerase [Gemmobacter aquaticus]|uniref:5-oxoprolinase subunit A n=1 Tax=Gemmobacter aquaticus TaxID=490185 RepID=A0A917YMJ2_9RHOB|nr:5-oxoprolinase subunit PxpA [Gemmobacter aquaticus]GGO38629.1 3-beta hydroxysteroid dehydrogenase/isomerase [Gemmobacter aquaticus]